MHVQGHEHFIPTKFCKYPLSCSVVKADYVFPYMNKSKKTSKTRQKFDFGMEPKITTFLSTCFKIIGILLACRCSLPVCALSLFTLFNFNVCEWENAYNIDLNA